MFIFHLHQIKTGPLRFAVLHQTKEHVLCSENMFSAENKTYVYYLLKKVAIFRSYFRFDEKASTGRIFQLMKHHCASVHCKKKNVNVIATTADSQKIPANFISIQSCQKHCKVEANTTFRNTAVAHAAFASQRSGSD